MYFPACVYFTDFVDHLLLWSFLFVCYKIHFFKGMNFCVEYFRSLKFLYIFSFFSMDRVLFYLRKILLWSVMFWRMPWIFSFDYNLICRFCVCAELQWVSISSFGFNKKICTMVYFNFLRGDTWIYSEKSSNSKIIHQNKILHLI